MKDRDKLDGYALEFARTGDGHAFEELLRIMDPILKYEARKRENEYIHYDELYLMFQETVWEAALDFNGEKTFIQRCMHIMYRKFIDLCRHYRAQKRFPIKPLIYLANDGNEETESSASPLWLVENSAVEQTVEENLYIKELLDGFARTNEQQGKIIKLIHFGCTNKEIASIVFGENEYGDRPRKGVQRAKQKFKEYLDNAA
ncbi:hypothetical protein GJ688_13695 [Heliobacillus mobilis]|uniref:RNA polymerase sigma-70 ECF-like HTH domain-containing protein n=1 Tax=Heliobacterium mobile TaxID=28064 RepID=A0A6I3SMS5_HELMO|nr:sigma-70 family RNA polymerase sigma factor [Heliobacterium mobile]MTV50025.1 hypothetical protein [Heliobacterium mobile]